MSIRPCQCNHEHCNSCSVTPGPAFMVIERAGLKIDVCTRCKLPADEVVEIIIKKGDSMEPFMAHDAEGAMVMFLCGVLVVGDAAEPT